MAHGLLFVCINPHKSSPFQGTEIKKFLRRGNAVSPDSTPVGEGDTSCPNPTPIGAYGASSLAPLALDLSPPFQNPAFTPAPNVCVQGHVTHF